MSDALLERLADLLAADGGLLASAVRRPPSEARHELGDAVARAPRAAGHAADLPLVVEAVYEGYLLHHGRPRVLDESDRDLALLAGDRLYAAGLERLAAAGDVESVRALADVIALGAAAHARDDHELASAAWEAGAAEVGWGATPALQRAKQAGLRGTPGADRELRAAARAARGPAADRRGGT